MALLASCALDGGEEVSTDEEALVSSPQGSTIAATVLVGVPGTQCSGTVLTEHWVLTAAHCVKGLPAATTLTLNAADVAGRPTMLVYQGPAQVYSDPSWGGNPDYYVSHDIALIRAASPITGFSQRGYLFSDAAGHPWYGNYLLNGWTEGYGGGTEPDNIGCLPDTTLRRNLYEPEGSSNTIAISSNRLHCGGDSGGPWMFNLYDTQWRMVQYAVTQGYHWGGIVGGSIGSVYDAAAAIQPALPWIESTMVHSSGAGYRVVITDGVASGYHYHAYTDQPIGTLQVAISGNGTVASSPSPVNGGTCAAASSCAMQYPTGTFVTLTASPALQNAFVGWTGCGSPAGNKCYLFGADTAITAQFRALSCHVVYTCQTPCVQECALDGGLPVSVCTNRCRSQCTVCN